MRILEVEFVTAENPVKVTVIRQLHALSRGTYLTGAFHPSSSVATKLVVENPEDRNRRLVAYVVSEEWPC